MLYAWRDLMSTQTIRYIFVFLHYFTCPSKFTLFLFRSLTCYTLRVTLQNKSQQRSWTEVLGILEDFISLFSRKISNLVRYIYPRSFTLKISLYKNISSGSDGNRCIHIYLILSLLQTKIVLLISECF